MIKRSWKILTFASTLALLVGCVPTPDITKPIVQLTTNGGTIIAETSKKLSLLAEATDDQKVIKKVDFYRNGTLVYTDPQAPFAYETSFTPSDNGTYTYKAMAFDGSDNQGESNAVEVKVEIPVFNPPTSDTGTLELNILGPSGATFSPDITVVDSKGSSQKLANFGNQNLTVPVGSSKVEVASITETGSVVDTIYRGFLAESNEPISNVYNVAKNASTKVGVQYLDQAFSGSLWATSFSTRITGFTDTQLSGSSGSLAGNLVGSGVSLASIAFDNKGYIWATDMGAGSVKKFKSGNPTPVLTFSSSAFSFPSGLVFDKNGNLWVSNEGNNALLRFNGATIRNAKGVNSFEPSAVITSVPTARWDQIAFDKDGNLWGVNFAGLTVHKFAGNKLDQNPNPAVEIKGNGAGFPDLWGIAFDKDSNLWIADGTDVRKYDAEVIDSSGAPTPKLTLKGLGSPKSMAFDKNANLWVRANNKVVKIASGAIASLTGPNTISPEKSFTTTLPNAGIGLAFYPVPDNLPIYH